MLFESRNIMLHHGFL